MSSAHVVNTAEKPLIFFRSKAGVKLLSQRGDHSRDGERRLGIYQEFPISHDFLVINPDVELASDDVNVG